MLPNENKQVTNIDQKLKKHHQFTMQFATKCTIVEAPSHTRKVAILAEHLMETCPWCLSYCGTQFMEFHLEYVSNCVSNIYILLWRTLYGIVFLLYLHGTFMELCLQYMLQWKENAATISQQRNAIFTLTKDTAIPPTSSSSGFTTTATSHAGEWGVCWNCSAHTLLTSHYTTLTDHRVVYKSIDWFTCAHCRSEIVRKAR